MILVDKLIIVERNLINSPHFMELEDKISYLKSQPLAPILSQMKPVHSLFL
jgi:hypothetical protein